MDTKMDGWMIDSTFSTYKMLLVCTFLYIFRADLVLDNHLVCSSQEATISLVLSIPHFSEVLCNLKHINAMIFNEAKLWTFFWVTQSCSILLTISWVSHALLEFPFIFLCLSNFLIYHPLNSQPLLFWRLALPLACVSLAETDEHLH